MTRSFRKKVFTHVLAAAAIIALVLGAFSAASLLAQTTPPSGLDGDWKNVDPHTRGIDVILIKGKKIHPFGTCHPTDCDWGMLRAKKVVTSAGFTYTCKRLVYHYTATDATDPATDQTYTINWAEIYETVEITISLLPNGQLRVETFTHFTHKSDRTDAHSPYSRAPSDPVTNFVYLRPGSRPRADYSAVYYFSRARNPF